MRGAAASAAALVGGGALIIQIKIPAGLPGIAFL